MNDNREIREKAQAVGDQLTRISNQGELIARAAKQVSANKLSTSTAAKERLLELSHVEQKLNESLKVLEEIVKLHPRGKKLTNLCP